MAFNFNNKSEPAKKVFKVAVGKNDNEYVSEGVYHVVGENEYSVKKKLRNAGRVFNDKRSAVEIFNIQSIEVEIGSVIA